MTIKSKFLSLLSAVMLVSFSALYAQDEAADDMTGTVNGSVTASDGSNISGALVQLAGGETTDQMATSGNGWYQFVDINPGSYQLTFSANGYETESASVTVSSGSTDKINVVLKSNGLN